MSPVLAKSEDYSPRTMDIEVRIFAATIDRPKSSKPQYHCETICNRCECHGVRTKPLIILSHTVQWLLVPSAVLQ